MASLLTYTSSPTPWYLLDPKSAPLTAFTLGIATLFLSYQVSTLISSLLLHPRHAVHTLQTLHLVRTASPLSISTALTSSDVLTRMLHRLPSGHGIQRQHSERIRLSVALRLFTLLLIPPIANIASLIITFSPLKTLTFREAGFQGIRMNFTDTEQILKHEKHCRAGHVGVGVDDEILASFSICESGVSAPNTFMSSGQEVPKEAGFGLLLLDHQTSVFYGVNEQAMLLRLTSVVAVEGVEYFLRPSFPVEKAKQFVQIGMEMIKEVCNMTETTEFQMQSGGMWNPIYAEKGPCQYAGNKTELGFKIFAKIATRFNFVESDDFEVWEENTKKVDGFNLPFVNRRRRYFGTTGVAAVAAIALVLRLIVAKVTGMEAGEIFEKVVETGVGIELAEGLEENDWIEYAPSPAPDNVRLKLDDDEEMI